LTSREPRVAFGAPVYNRAEYLVEAIESLLAQSYPDFALVLVDDCSTDATPDIIERYAARDPRVSYQRNDERVGMVENWRRAYRAAAERVPGLEYFAFASDHDVWHPLWLESMVRELDADPAVVVAFPLWIPIGEDSRRLDFKSRQRWEKATVADPRQRVDSVAPGRGAPNVIYGLFRAAALERCDVFSFVLAPDRLLMSKLAVLGTFKQVDRELWMRRLWRDQRQRSHQRTRLFPGRAPLHTYLPRGLVHTAALFSWLVLKGRGRPEVDRIDGLAIAGLYAGRECMYPTLRRYTQFRRWARPLRKWAHRRRKAVRRRHGRPLRTARRWARTKRKDLRRLRRRGVRGARSAAKSLAASVLGASNRRES
jgi:glycosyltransferase involved in cell wall biosynthesis